MLSAETKEIFGRLLKAHLDLEQSHEYLRQKMDTKMKEQTWSLADMFEASDIDGRGYISLRDFHTILQNNKNKNFS
jgi:Ca2+-binding EF-hand superfamily protein